MSLRAAVYQNSFAELDHAFQSTGFRPSSQRFGASFRPDTDANVGDLFLANTRLVRGDRETQHSIAAYFTDVASMMLSMLGRRRSATAQVALRKPIPIRMALSEAIRRRRTQRALTGDRIDFAHLSTILFAGNGITTQANVNLAEGECVKYRYRTTASAGGLYPVDILVAAHNVNGIEKGIYRHDPVRQGLEPILDSSGSARLLDTFCLPENIVSVSRAGAVILMIGHPWRAMGKYGPRGARFVFIEAGSMAQNMALAASALGYSCIPCASIYDDEVHELLGLDGISSALVHALILGCPG